MSDLFVPADLFETKKAKIKVIGVGGGGGNAINHMVNSGLKDIDFIAVNTDAQDLRRNKAPYLVQVGEKITKGLGVGGDPEKGRRAAEDVRRRHGILSSFLSEVLGVNAKTANIDACKMEHVISRETLEKLHDFLHKYTGRPRHHTPDKKGK